MRCPHAHARIVDIDVTDALDVDGRGRDLHLRGPARTPRRVASRCRCSSRTRRCTAAHRTRWPTARCTTSASRSSWWSPATVTSPRTRATGSGSSTSRCRPSSASRRARAAEHLVHEDVPGNVAAHMVQEVGDADAAIAAAPHTLELDLAIERSARCRWRARASRPLGRRRPVPAGVLLDPGVDLGAAAHRREARAAGRPGRGDRAGRRRRLRREDHAPVAGGDPGAVGGDAARAAGEVDRGPPRALHLLRPRARPGAPRPGRIRRRRPDARPGVRFWHDNGAYTPYGIIVPIITSTQLLGPYKPGAYRVEFHSLYTNTVIVTPYRGAGRPQGCSPWSARWTRSPRPRPGPRRGARAQLHPAGRDAVRPGADLPGRPAADLRLRQLPGVAGDAQGAGRLGRLRGRTATQARGRGPAGRHRARLLRRGHRRRAVRGRPRPGGDRRHAWWSRPG